MNFNPYSNPNYGVAIKQNKTLATTPTSNNTPQTPQKETTTLPQNGVTQNLQEKNKQPTTSDQQQQPTATTTTTGTTNNNRRSALTGLDGNVLKNLTQEIEREELASPKGSSVASTSTTTSSTSSSSRRLRSQSRIVNMDKDSDDEDSEEESNTKNDQVRTILTVEVTVIKPMHSTWKTVSNSSLLSVYSSERKQAVTSEVEIPTELAVWKESQKKKGFDLYLFLKLNENVQFQILKSVTNDTGSEQISSSYLVIKYVDKRTEKIQFIGLVFSSVGDLQSTYNLLQRCIVSVPTFPISAQSPSKSKSAEELSIQVEKASSEEHTKINNCKKVLVDHLNDQILYHTKQMCYHELQKEELLKQLQKLENEK